MHCLLCHEKIPRLRAWTGKSEFCCDEHAELYKKQTIDRLLIDDSAFKSAAPALPISDGGTPSVDHILLKDQSNKAQGGAPSVDHILLRGQPSKARRGDGFEEPAEVEELWKLADNMGDQEEEPAGRSLYDDISGKGQDYVQSQSADEALAALQALAAEARTRQSDDDLLDEFARMESSFESLPPLESLPADLADGALYDDLVEAPELELDALDWSQTTAPFNAAAELAAEAVEADELDAPDLVLEDLAQEGEESLAPPEIAADLDVEQLESLELPEVAWEELQAVANTPDAQPPVPVDPLEPAELELEALAEVKAEIPAAAPVARRTPKTTPSLRPATDWQVMIPSPSLPEGDYALAPWLDALAEAGPDSVSLLGPSRFSDLRKASLNGTASAKFDAVQFRASERISAIEVPVLEPNSQLYEEQDGVLMPAPVLAWPAPLHAIWSAAEMRLSEAVQSVSSEESLSSVRQPTLSAEFLSRVAFQGSILEPECSAILSPQDRGAYTSAAAEEEESGSEYASAAGRLDRNETDRGERANVADLF